MSTYLTQDDVNNYGAELIDVAQRSALHAVAPHLQNLQQQNAELQQQLAREARRSLDQRVAQAVPNYQEIDRDPRWHDWLLTTDPLSGRLRQQLLNDAIASGDERRIAAFFRTFQGTSTGQAAQPPSRRMPMWGPDRRIYSRAEIAKLYRQHAQGAYAGREAEWGELERDIIAAARDGRVQNPEAVGVK